MLRKASPSRLSKVGSVCSEVQLSFRSTVRGDTVLLESRLNLLDKPREGRSREESRNSDDIVDERPSPEYEVCLVRREHQLVSELDIAAGGQQCRE